MTTATPERADDKLVSQPDTKLLYMARREELRLTHTQRYPVRGAMGQQVGETEGVFVSFRDGVFRCPTEGEVELRDTLNGGRARVDAAELIAWLNDHPLNGDKHDGFWIVDPTAPAPSKQELKTLIRLSQRAEVDKLEEFIAQERAGWNRADLLEAAEEALDASRAAVAEMEAESKATAKANAEKPEK